MRIYDPRLGRFLSVDPLSGSFPWNSCYAYAENDPINFVDVDGMEQPSIRPVVTQPTSGPRLVYSSARTVTPQNMRAIRGGQLPSANPGRTWTDRPAQANYYTGLYVTGGTGLFMDNGYGQTRYIPSQKEVGQYYAAQEQWANDAPKREVANKLSDINKSVERNAIVEHTMPDGTTQSLTNFQTRIFTQSALNAANAKLSIPSSIPVYTPFKGHGNRKDNTNPQMVYVFTYVPSDGGTPFLKFGVADLEKNINRPENQLAAMRKKWGNTADWKPLLYTPDRASAYAAEAAAVLAHEKIYNEKPRDQIKP